MPQYYRNCSITISQAAGEKRSYNSSKTQKSSLHNFSSLLLNLEQEGNVEARDLVPKLLLLILSHGVSRALLGSFLRRVESETLGAYPKFPKRGQMVRKCPGKSSRKSENCWTSEKPTIQPKIPRWKSNGTEISRKNFRILTQRWRRRTSRSAGLCSKNRVLCFRASPMKPGYYAQNYARLEVLCSIYAGLKWHFTPPPP